MSEAPFLYFASLAMIVFLLDKNLFSDCCLAPFVDLFELIMFSCLC